jgi:hypothetical protein
MARLAYLGSIALAALAYAALPAFGQQDETRRILAQCSDPPPDQIDSCLEQARVQEETDPSSDLQNLVASLIKRQVEARNAPQEVAPPQPDADNSGSYEAPPEAAPQELAPPAVPGDPSAADENGDNSGAPPDGDQPDSPPDNGGEPRGT